MTVNLDPAIQQRLRVRGIPGAGRKCVGLSLSALLQELSYQAGPEPGWGSQGLQITGLQLLPFLLHRGRDAFWSIRRRLPNSFFPKAHLSELLPQQPLNPLLRGRKMLLFQVLGERRNQRTFGVKIPKTVLYGKKEQGEEKRGDKLEI